MNRVAAVLTFVGAVIILFGVALAAIYPSLIIEKPTEVAVKDFEFPPDVVDVYLILPKKEVKVGEPYDVSVFVRNKYFHDLYVFVEVYSVGPTGKVTEMMDLIKLREGEQRKISFVSYKGQPGTYAYKAIVRTTSLIPLDSSKEEILKVYKIKNVLLDFKSNTNTIKVGKEFLLTAKVTNLEEVPISGTLSIIKDGSVIQTYTLSVDPGKTVTADYRTSVGTVGEHTFVGEYKVDDLALRSSVSIYAYDLGALTSTTITASKTEARVGEVVDIVATAVNNHEESVSGTLYIYRDGTIISSNPITIDAKSEVSVAVSETSSVKTTRTYKSVLVVGNYQRESSEIKVKFYEVVGEVKINLTAKEKVRPNETYTVTVNVVNGRNVPLSGTLEVLSNEYPEYSTKIYLNPGESKTISYTTFKDREGTYVYLSRILTSGAHFVSNAYPVKVEKHPLRKFIESAGFAFGLPLVPLMFVGVGSAITAGGLVYGRMVRIG